MQALKNKFLKKNGRIIILLLSIFFLIQPWFSFWGPDFFSRADLIAATSSLTITKLVKDITLDHSSWQGAIQANPSDRIAFQIQINSTGTAEVENIYVKDVLPSKLTYEGNLKIDGSYFSGDILSGLSLGDLSSGKSKIITFEAQVVPEGDFVHGTTTLVNQVSAWADGVADVRDSATMVVTKGTSSGVSLNIEKKAQNKTSGQTSWRETVTAAPSDKIAFRVEVTSTGDERAYDIVVKDALPENIVWHGNLEIDDEESSKDITEGIDIGDLSPGSSKTITFEALLGSKEDFPYGSTELINTALVFNEDIASTDTAKITVTRTSIAGSVTEVPTGILSSAKISLFLVILISFLGSYVLLFKSYISERMTGFSFGDIVFETKEKAQDFLLGLYLTPEEKSRKQLSRAVKDIRKQEGLK